jgi:hypothetical protein
MNARAQMGVLCVAASWLCACGRSGLDPSGGAAGSAGVAGVAGTTGNNGSAGTAGVSGTSGSAGAIDAGADDAETGGAADGASSPFAYAAVAGCSKDGWCWSTPTPQGNSLASISGSSADDVWAVGDAGAIVHWDGHSWTQVPSGVQSPLRGVWADGPRDAWAVGDVILHWDGMTWSVARAPAPNVFWQAVWGAGPSDVWIVGYVQPTTAGGFAGAAMHWDGSQWTTTLIETQQSLEAVWGTGPDDVWTLDDAQGFFHWDGQRWTTVSTGQLPCFGRAIWGTSSSDLWLGADCAALPSHWNGLDAEVSGDMSEQIDGLWGSGANDVWAVGDVSTAGDLTQDPYMDGGLILHWNGLAWDPTSSTGAGRLFGVWGSRSDDVWAVGEGGDIVHWDGRAWSAPAGPPHVVLDFIWGSGPDDVWAFGYDELGLGALRWNGQTWARTELLDVAGLGASNGLDIPYAAWGSGPNDIWVGVVVKTPIPEQTGNFTASSLFVHWDGRAWSRDTTLDSAVAASMVVYSMWGNGPKDVWAVGQIESEDHAFRGMAVRWDGTRWSAVTSLSSTDLAYPFFSVWSSSPNDVWIGTEVGILHWDGQSWSEPIADERRYVVGGSGPADVWAVTQMTDLLPSNASHWNGTSWQQSTAPVVGGGMSLVSSSPTNAWLLYDEAVAHWDGTAWTPSDTGTDQFELNLYWDGTQVWTIAVGGVIRHP